MAAENLGLPSEMALEFSPFRRLQQVSVRISLKQVGFLPFLRTHSHIIVL
jgi:hypothetical protein